jgi:hypothetical protein
MDKFNRNSKAETHPNSKTHQEVAWAKVKKDAGKKA